MSRTQATSLGLFLAGLSVTLGCFTVVHLLLGLAWGVALIVAAGAGLYGVVAATRAGAGK